MELLTIGFRPFFLLAALAAALLVPMWLALLLLGVSWPSPLPPMLWHAHEMLFGYTAAVIAGFLLTAVQNWTGQVVARDRLLFGLAGLWIAGRIACAVGGAFSLGMSAAIDLAFLPAVAVTVAWPIARTRNRRNAVMPVMLLVLAFANALLWIGALGGDGLAIVRGQRLALDTIALLIMVIGGRIVPNFTANAVPGIAIRPPSALDTCGVAAMAALLAIDVADPQSKLAGHGAAVAGALNAARLWGWGGSRTLAKPILAVLHVGFACTALALVLRAYAILTGLMFESHATHMLTIGGIGLMTLGMMARVALGHTGRPLVLPASIVLALYCVALSAMVRVLGPVVAVEHYRQVLWLSGGLWTVAFVLYLVRYAPILVAPRADERRPG